MTKKRLPIFNSKEEEANFWDTHDSIEFLDEFKPAEIEVAPELEQRILTKRELKKPVTLRLEPAQIEDVKRIASRKGLPYQTLIRMWITEAIQQEGSF